jgi:uncharacterized protein (DUF427 family)
MKAIWNKEIIAQAEKEQLIRIEGNWYFPPKSLNWEFFSESDHHTSCPWKGEASYYHVTVNGEVNQDGAWYYIEPFPSAIERVKKDFSNYVAFWHGVEMVE